MEIIKKIKTKYKSVPDGTYEEEWYKTSDGKEFKDKKEADRYEYHSKFNLIEHLSNDIPELGYNWYIAKNEEELETLKSHFDSNGKVSVDGNFEIGKWMNVIYENGGDYSNRVYVITLDYFKDEVEKFLNKLNK